MAKKDSILRVLDREAPTTSRVLSRAPLDRADWKPHPKSMSLGHLTGWIAGAPGWTASAIGQDGFDVSKFQPLPAPKTAAAAVEAYETGLAAARRALEQ